MLEVGISYQDEIKPSLLALIRSPVADVQSVEDVAGIAKGMEDNEVFLLALQRVLDDPKTKTVSPKLLIGTNSWEKAEREALEEIKSSDGEGAGSAWFGINGITFGSASTVILDLSKFLLEHRVLKWRPVRRTLRELDKRGWRLRLHGRKIAVLRRGQEEARANADYWR